MKKKYPLKMSSTEVLFPQARPTKALQEEDAFMQAHGGAGPRICYYIAEGLGVAVEAIPMLIRRIPALRKTRGFGIYIPPPTPRKNRVPIGGEPHDYMDAGGTRPWMVKGRTMQDAYMEVGGRVTQELLPSYCRGRHRSQSRWMRF